MTLVTRHVITLQRTVEAALLRMTRGIASRLRVRIYRALGMRQGIGNRIEGGGRSRRLNQIRIGSYNAFTQGCWLWPIDGDYEGVRIQIGDRNYFNRNVMIDACGFIEIGSDNMFGPDSYITDSNHTIDAIAPPGASPMQIGRVKIGNRCWIGAKVIILKDVELGDGCVVGAGAVVTRSFPPASVIAGVPAQELRRLIG